MRCRALKLLGMAVYTTLTADDIRTHLARYDIGALVAHAGISEGVENTNYLIETEQGKFILTLFEKRVDKQALPFYLAFMQSLQDTGVPTAGVVTTRTGETTAQLAGKTALVTRFLSGTWQRHPTAAHTREVGALVALMHLTGRDMKQERANAMSLPAWQSLISACGARADEVAPGLEKELSAALAACAHTRHKNLPDGVVHADLFPDNIFFDDDGKISGVIDFYFSCRDTLVYDLMLTVNAWCFNAFGDIDEDRARNLIEGYLSVRQLDAHERAALPAMGRAAALRIISTRLYDWLHPVSGAIVRPKDPMEHVHILRYHARFDADTPYPWFPDEES